MLTTASAMITLLELIEKVEDTISTLQIAREDASIKLEAIAEPDSEAAKMVKRLDADDDLLCHASNALGEARRTLSDFASNAPQRMARWSKYVDPEIRYLKSGHYSAINE